MIDTPPAATAFWEAPQQLVRLPDGRHLNLYCTGPTSAHPVVVLEAGFGATTWAWARVQPLVARTARVCSYDRAGMGFSDAGPLPRDGKAIVADLRALLKAANIAPPYVLVAHSAGAMTMRLFANATPDEVAGMVLLDPSIEGQFDGQLEAVTGRAAADERCAVAAEAGQLPSTDPRLTRCTRPVPASVSPAFAQSLVAAERRASYWRTQASEYVSIAGVNSDALVLGPRDYGAMPLVVLTAGQTARADQRWEAWHVALSTLSTRGVQRTLPGAPHNLMSVEPAAVAAAINEVIAKSDK